MAEAMIIQPIGGELVDVEANAPQQQHDAAVAMDQALALPGAQERVEDAFANRWAGAVDVRTLRDLQVHLEQGSDVAAWETLERLEALERWFAAPNLLTAEYGKGVAFFEDEIQVLPGGRAIVTADHATDPFRKKTGVREAADQGTAAWAAAMALDGLADSFIMTGKQTGNVGVTPNHRLKRVVREQLGSWSTGVLSLHSKYPGQGGPFDDVESHAYIGYGRYAPRPQTVEIGERLQEYGADIGLRVAVGNTTYHAVYENDPHAAEGAVCNKLAVVKRDDEGLPVVSRLGGASKESLTSWMTEATHGDPVLGEIPVFQLEISNSLAVTARDRYTRDRTAYAMNVYCGYLLVRRATELTAGMHRQTR